MLKSLDDLNSRTYFERPPEPQEKTVDIGQVLAAVRRQALVFLLCAAIGVGVGYSYLQMVTPIYTSTARVFIDKEQSKTVTELVDSSTGQIDPMMASQVEILRSDRIALKVAERLNLASNVEFLFPEPSVFDRMKQFVGGLIGRRSQARPETIEATEATTQAALGLLKGGLAVERVGTTYVLAVSFSSPSPQLAALIAQTFAEAYIDDQLDAKYDATRRASTWLQARISELRTQTLDADLAVQQYRSENGLISAGGSLISDQQLSDLSTRLVQAQSETASAKARYDRAATIVETGNIDAVVDDSLNSSIITDLRSRYLDASKRQAEIAELLGPTHAQVVRLRNEMDEYKRQIFEEVGRIAESYRNSYDVAVSSEEDLRRSLDALMQQAASANTTQVNLRELEQTAETHRVLYQSFLTQYQQSLQEQSLPISEARIISAAGEPGSPTFPRGSTTLALFAVLGSVAGIGMGLAFEFRERFFRTAGEVREETGLDFLGLTPAIRPRSLRWRIKKPVGRLEYSNSGMRWAADHPLSQFSETLRAVKVSADSRFHDRRPKVIGVVSCLPGEGKTTIASNLALVLATQGAPTLLIDGDRRTSDLTTALGGLQGPIGLEEVLRDETITAHQFRQHETLPLSFLSISTTAKPEAASDVLGSSALETLLRDRLTQTAYVVVDLPPLYPTVDARAFMRNADGIVLVVEWGKTARSLVKQTLENEPELRGKCLGVLLSKVDMKRIKMYQRFGSPEYYGARYDGYFQRSKTVA